MVYSEKNLVKLLEAGALSFKKALNSISNGLKLDFLEEGSAVFISQADFAIEIDCGTKCLKLSFTDQKDDDLFWYLPKYLKFAIKKDLKIFYFLLKFYTKFRDVYEVKMNSEYKNTFCCECIFRGEYCINKTVDRNYNIFTHTQHDIQFNEKNIYAVEIGGNLYKEINSEFIDRRLLEMNSDAYYSDNELEIKGNKVLFKNKENCELFYLWAKNFTVADLKIFCSEFKDK